MRTLNKIIVAAFFAVFSISGAYSQSVGIGTETPSPNAALDIRQGSGPQGVLVPRMSTADMASLELGLIAPADLGMLIYNIDSTAFLYWNGTDFQNFGGNAVSIVDFPVDSVRAGTGIVVTYNNDTALVSLPSLLAAGTSENGGDSIPVITYDEQGRISNVSHVAIDAVDIPIDSVRAGVGIEVNYNNDTAIVSLPTVISGGTSYNGGDSIPVLTYDDQGRVTGFSYVPLAIAAVDVPVDSVRAGAGVLVNYNNDTAIVSLPSLVTAGTSENGGDSIPVITYDEQGRISNVSHVAIDAVDIPIDSVRAGVGVEVNYNNDTAIVSLPSVISGGTSYNGGDSIPVLNYDDQGRVTGFSYVPLAIAAVDTPVDSVRAGVGVEVNYNNDTAIVSLPSVISGGTSYNGGDSIPVLNYDDQGRVTGISYVANASDSDWQVSGNYVYSLDSIGIGTANPNAPLDVAGNVFFQSQLQVNGEITAENDIILNNGSSVFASGNVGADSLIVFDGTNAPSIGQVLTAVGTDGRAYWSSIPSSADNLGDHTQTVNLRTNGNYISGDGDNEGLFIDNDGNVGIGNNSPNVKLEISAGNVRLGVGRRVEFGNTGNYIGLNALEDDIELVSNDDVFLAPTDDIFMDLTNTGQMLVRNGVVTFGLFDANSSSVTIGGGTTPGNTLHVLGGARVNDLAGSASKLVIADAEGDLDSIAFTGSNADVLLGNGTFGVLPSGDDLGDHLADTNIVMNGNWINGDEDDNQGLFIDNQGNLGINTNTIAGALNIRPTLGNEISFPNTGDDVDILSISRINMSSASSLYFSVDGFTGLRMSSSGVMIGSTSSPANTLHVAGGARINNLAGSANKLVVADGSGDLDSIAFTGSNADVLLGDGTFGALPSGDNLGSHTLTTNLVLADFHISNDGDNEGILIDSSGNVSIGGVVNPSYKLYVYGKLKSEGITETSDLRLKKNIMQLDRSLEKVMALRGVSYDWKGNADKRKQIGLIAQELESVLPELVDTDAEGMKSVQYSKLVAVLLEAMKEQQGQIESLENQVNDFQVLKAEVEELKRHQRGFGAK